MNPVDVNCVSFVVSARKIIKHYVVKHTQNIIFAFAENFLQTS